MEGKARRLMRQLCRILVCAAALQAAVVAFGSGGGITITNIPLTQAQPAALMVTLAPAGVVSAGAGWRLEGETNYRSSGSLLSGLAPGNYTLQFSTVPGYGVPTNQVVSLTAGQETEVTYTYTNTSPPTPIINSLLSASAAAGQPFSYQITATNLPNSFSAAGLPAGLFINASTGVISGVPTISGTFAVTISAANSYGTDTETLAIVIIASAQAQVYEKVYSFTTAATANPTSGIKPYAGLVQGSDGNFYGTTVYGGTNGDGTVFKVTPYGVLTTLVNFTGTSGSLGANPQAGLIQGSDGNFYGTTFYGGINGDGTVFKVTPSGVLTTLVNFTGTSGSNVGANPQAGLIQGSDGNFYGTTFGGGTSGFGTVFRMTAAGALATLVNFADDPVAVAAGGYPFAGLIQGSDGNFYGTTASGGTNGDGTVFKVTPSGVPTTLVNFSGNGSIGAGGSPYAGLVQGTDGNFYGTTVYGGTNGDGTVFKLTPSGALTTLVTFTGTSGSLGANPQAGLIQGSDGNFYGTTSEGGANNLGTVFQMTPSGALTTIYDFSSDPFDNNPAASLTAGSDGNLYGTTFGSNGGDGSIYSLIFQGPPNIYPLPATIQNTAAVVSAQVSARGVTTMVSLEYGTEGVNFPNTVALGVTLNGYSPTAVSGTLSGLVPGVTYYYEVVATSASGTTSSPVLSFTIPGLLAPLAEVLSPTGIGAGANLSGLVNAENYSTGVEFDIGTDGSTFPIQVPANPATVTGTTDTAVSASVAGLTAGVTYYVRITATNVAGTTVSGAIAFTTAVTAMESISGAIPLSTNSAIVSGSVNANNSATQVNFLYGTDGVNFPNSIAATPAIVTGTSNVVVSATLSNLVQSQTYYYIIQGINAGGTSTSGIGSFTLAALSGLTQVLPEAPPAAEGFLLVNLTPAGLAGEGWRFAGEQQWRPPGVPVGGLPSGNFTIEFQPVPGYLEPSAEVVNVTSTETTVVTAEYYPSAGASGGINVTIQPASLTNPAISGTNIAQWRLVGETTWRDSGSSATGLSEGVYLIEFKPVPGETTAATQAVAVPDGQTTVATTGVYFLSGTAVGTPPEPLSYSAITSETGQPYAYVGQIRGDDAAATGFVVLDRVVATAGHVIFDDATLSYTSGLQWLFQREAGTYEPIPQMPAGAYLLDGYAAARIAANTPGVATPQSQDLDAAAMYFLEDAGRGGFSGYLASDSPVNEFLTSSALMTLVGYPVDGIPAANQGQMFATLLANIDFSLESPAVDAATGVPYRLYATTDITAAGGAAGAPLFVQFQGGNYYPAGIYVGGDGETVVRAIDSQVVNLFTAAEVSGNGGQNQSGAGIINVAPPGSAAATSGPGELKVTLNPPSASWSLDNGITYQVSGATLPNLVPGTYQLTFAPVAGYSTPAAQNITVDAGNIASVVFSYVSSTQNYTVTPSAGFNGTVGPSAAQVVSSGGGVEFTATPDAGYAVDQWLLNGSVVQNGGDTFALNNVLSNATVEVTFIAGTSQMSTQTITFQPIATRSLGDAAFPLNATSSSDLPVTFTVLSGPAAIDVTGTNLELMGTGVVLIEADQGGNATYSPAPSAFQSFRVLGNTAIFEALPDLTGSGLNKTDGNAVSNGGLYAVGDVSGNYGVTAVRWDPYLNITDFNPTGPAGDDSAYAISGDGTMVVGEKLVGGLHSAFVGSDSADITLLAPLGGDDSGEAYGMSADGQYVVGFTYSSALGKAASHAVEWTNGTAMPLTGLTGTSGSQARGVSADGQIIVGATPRQVPEATVTEALALVRLVPEPLVLGSVNVTKIHGTAYAATEGAGGYTVVGSSAYTDSTNGIHLAPFRSVNGEQPIVTGSIDATDNVGEALSISADGSIIVGYGTSGGQQMATIWDAQHGLRTLAQALTDDYGAGAQIAGWQLLSANGISPDGFAVTGNGINPQGNPQAWRVIVPQRATVGLVAPATVSEGASSVAVAVSKSAGVGTEVNYQIVPGTAIQVVDGVGDYDASQLSRQLYLNTADTSGTITIPLNPDLAPAPGGSRSFTVKLTGASDGAVISSGTATVTIEASQTPDPNGPVLPQIPPGALPSQGALQVILLKPGSTDAYGPQVPGEVPGWRFAGESAWRSSGDIVTGLAAPGSFPVEFESLVDFSTTPPVLQPAPAPAVATVVAGGTTVDPIAYPTTNSAETGSIEVVIKPDSVGNNPFTGQRGQWRFAGESAWNDSGAIISNVPAGAYEVEFSPVPDYDQIPSENIQINTGNQTLVQVLYQAVETVTGTLPQVLSPSTVTGSSPYDFVGEVSTDVGTASGVVVAQRVVLTAAHAIFDDAAESFATGVQWRFQRIAGLLEPLPLTPQGAYVLSGYAAARAGAPSGVGTPASQDQDAAVLYFEQSAGNGGASGYLVSGTASPWLLSNRQKILIGYPTDTSQPGDPNVTPGQMQATPPAVVAFLQTGTSVFETTQIAGLSGMSGGPLCVQYDDGYFYPAGIYLGGNQQCVVRSIDENVEGLIKSGTASSQDGDDHASGGEIQVQSDVIGSEYQVSTLTVEFAPGTPSTASWRFTTDPPSTSRPLNQPVTISTDTSYTVTFNKVYGFIAPADYGPFHLAPGENRTIEVGYGEVKAPVITTSALPIGGVGLAYAGKIEAMNSPTNFSAEVIDSPSGVPASNSIQSVLGLMLAKNGKLTGTILQTATGTYEISVTASNAGGTSGVRDLDLIVAQTGTFSVNFDPSRGSVKMGAEKLASGQTFTLPQGEPVTLTATPRSPANVFGGWFGVGTENLSSPGRTLQFQVPSTVSLTGSFVPSPFLGAAGRYAGLIAGDADNADSRGYFTAEVTGNRAFSMAFNLGAKSYSIDDKFDDYGALLHVVKGSHNSVAATLNLQLGFSGSDTLTGILSVSGTAFAIDGNRTGFSAGDRRAGKYTLVLPNVTGSGLPQGDGYGTVTVTPGGAVHFAGELGDGTPISESTTLDSAGDWPFFSGLYHKGGAITGWLNVNPSTAPIITGTL
jgi:uncharacterized repeat protein (TIGR03803 family)